MDMPRKLLTLSALLVALALPGTALALSPSDFKNAAHYCKAVRADMGVSLFKQTYGTNHNRSNALGKCVSKQARVEHQNKSNAAKDCKAERDAGVAAFEQKYGTGKKHSNAFGKCVSQKAKAASQAQQQETLNAAEQCKAERSQGADAFRAKYGTNRNKRNAFGKCVSQTAKS
jgi:hypothetical protein